MTGARAMHNKSRNPCVPRHEQFIESPKVCICVLGFFFGKYWLVTLKFWILWKKNLVTLEYHCVLNEVL